MEFPFHSPKRENLREFIKPNDFNVFPKFRDLVSFLLIISRNCDAGDRMKRWKSGSLVNSEKGKLATEKPEPVEPTTFGYEHFFGGLKTFVTEMMFLEALRIAALRGAERQVKNVLHKRGGS